jgi:hypothetical protein
MLEPYDLALTDLPAGERRAWGARVIEALEDRFGQLQGTTFEVHAGAAYRHAIGGGLSDRGAMMSAPLARLPLGRQLAWYRDHTDRVERRQTATAAEIEAALEALDRLPHRVRANDWPDDLRGLDMPGLCSWWVDAKGANDLQAGLGHRVEAGRIYAGQTGATKWPSGKTSDATLWGRINDNHLNGLIRGSTFRLTLAAALRRSLNLEPAGPKKLTADSERRLSAWLREHLELAVHPFPEADALEHLEHGVLRRIDPPLNLRGMDRTPLRESLSTLRRGLSR